MILHFNSQNKFTRHNFSCKINVATIKLQALLLVDGAKVTTDTAGINVSVEVLEEIKGPKIDILRYKSKTGYRRRQGFRAKLTRVKVTSINGVK